MSPPGKHKRCPLVREAALAKVDRSSKDLHHTPITGYAVGGLQQAIDNASSDWWWTGAVQAIKQLAIVGYFDADRLLNLVGEPPHPSYLGAAFAAAQRSGWIEAVGCRIAVDGRLLRVWHGVVR